VFRQLQASLNGNGPCAVKKEVSPRLRSLADWDRMLESSRTRPALVFKHSTICGISSNVLAEVEEFLVQHQSVPFGIVHVVEDRSLSALIADRTGIRHESPQMIAIANELPIWHASHWSIDLNELERFLAYTAERRTRPTRT
jgi:bacillithiol system protein YtxJ